MALPVHACFTYEDKSCGAGGTIVHRDIPVPTVVTVCTMAEMNCKLGSTHVEPMIICFWMRVPQSVATFPVKVASICSRSDLDTGELSIFCSAAGGRIGATGAAWAITGGGHA
jgi:hypothetical protein